jgi:hypothetical protein
MVCYPKFQLVLVRFALGGSEQGLLSQRVTVPVLMAQGLRSDWLASSKRCCPSDPGFLLEMTRGTKIRCGTATALRFLGLVARQRSELPM